MDITVKKKDETKIQIVSSDSGILREISEHFTFFAEGYKYAPAYKNKSWDGKIRIFSLRDNSLPYGLLGELLEFCKTRNYSFSIDEKITKTYCPSTEELKRYCDSIPLSTRGQMIELRDYQFDGIANAIKNMRALTISPTASGKSAMIYMICRWFLDNCDEDQKILISVPSTGLVEQLKKDFIDYSEFDKHFNADAEVHQIYSGKEKDHATVTNYKITLADGTTINASGAAKVKLTDGKIKFIRDLTKSDDIDEIWLKNMK